MNPYFIIALIVAWLASIYYADDFGYDRAINEVKAAQLQRQNEAIEKHNTLAAADTAGAVVTETRVTYVRDRAKEKEYELELDIERKRREEAERRAAHPGCPVCSGDLDERSLGLLISTIRAANNPEAPAAGQPDRGPGADPRAR